MENRKYYTNAVLMALILPPLVCILGYFLGASLTVAVSYKYTVWFVLLLTGVILPALIFMFLWHLLFRKSRMPESWGKRIAPVVAVFIYYVGIWSLIFGISGYNYSHPAWHVFFYLVPFYVMLNFLFLFSGSFTLFPIINLVFTLLSLITLVFTCRRKQPRATVDTVMWISVTAMVALCMIVGFQYYERTNRILGRDSTAERVEDGLNYNHYKPFHTDTRLVQMTEKPFLTIDRNYPRLDGATAIYPVYGAVAQEIYKGLDVKTVGKYVECFKTEKAYERLINGEIDIFFGAQPSLQHIEKAKAKGLEFEQLPIAREAFVFFVNAQNPVTDLSLDQLRDIYTKKITRWHELGGMNETIMAFQRPENSGSQTIMQAKVMGETPLPAPLREEYAGTMGGVINQVASYRNYTGSIGYSFRFFVTGMRPNKNIRLIAINGVEPTVDTIRNETYPFTVEIYAVTARPKSENTQKLLDWLVSRQGQDLIEQCGYVRRWD